MSKLAERSRFRLLLAGAGALFFGASALAEEEKVKIDPFIEGFELSDCAANYEGWGYETRYECESVWRNSQQTRLDEMIAVEAEANEGMFEEFLNETIGQFEDMISNVFTGVAEIFTVVFLKGQTDTSESYAKVGDGVNQARVTSEEIKLQNSTMIAPQSCESATMGNEAMNTNASSKQDNVDLAKKTIGLRVNQTPETNPFDDIAKNIEYKYGKYSENKNGHLDISLITSEVNLDAVETKQALDVVDNLTITGFDKPYQSLFKDEAEHSKQESSVKKQLNMHEQHFLFARHVLNKSVTRRVASSDKRSVLGVMETDINRTYAGDAWRTELQGFASSVPLHEECLKQQALNNHITNERIKIREDKVRLCALTALARLDSEGRKEMIFSKY
jgi:hypothetical protein